MQALAARFGTPEAAAAARALSVPRSRLPAELAFLPGAAQAAPVVLHALAHAMRPDPATLTPAARANLVAHLCAAGAASEGEQDRLARLQPAPADPALADAIDADRAIAGIPPVQRAAMPAEQDALADRHAAALVFACRAANDPPTRLAALVRAAGDGAPAAFMRRVAATWSRQSVSNLAHLDEAAATAERSALKAPSPEATERFAASILAWAALTAPQRASDARAGLDHAPTLTKIRAWRGAGIRLSEAGHPALALRVAETLATTFADLPGESARLHDDARQVAGLVEEQTLEAALQPLRTLAAQLAADPVPLHNALAQIPFGPASPGVAGRLWTAFDNAASACRQSEAPWTIMRDLAARLGGEHKLSGAPAALALHRGFTARAEAAGFTNLATRLHAEDRGLERAAALMRYIILLDDLKKTHFGAFLLRRRALAAIAAALPLVDDEAERGALLTDEKKIKRGARTAIGVYAVLAAVVFAVASVRSLDQSYADNAPYRHAAPQSLDPAPTAPPRQPRAPAPDPGIMAGIAPSDSDPVPAPVSPPVPLMPKAPEPPPLPSAPTLRLAFPTRTTLPEREPHDTSGRVRTLPEVRWCEFNKLRLQAALADATPPQEDALRALIPAWTAVCDTYPNYRRDEEQVASEAARFHDRLAVEGRAMLKAAP